MDNITYKINENNYLYIPNTNINDKIFFVNIDKEVLVLNEKEYNAYINEVISYLSNKYNRYEFMLNIRYILARCIHESVVSYDYKVKIPDKLLEKYNNTINFLIYKNNIKKRI